MTRLIIIGAFAKAAFMTAIVTTFAAAEPFWHQAVIVLGSATITALAMLGSAHITARRLERTVEETHNNVADLKKAAGLIRREDDP